MGHHPGLERINLSKTRPQQDMPSDYGFTRCLRRELFRVIMPKYHYFNTTQEETSDTPRQIAPQRHFLHHINQGFP